MKKLHIKNSVFLNVFALGAGIFLFYLIIQVSGKSFLNLLKQTAAIKYYFLAAVTAASTLLSVFIAKRWSLLMSAYTDVKTLPRGFIFYNTNIGLLINSILPVFGYVGAKSASFKLEHNIAVRKTVYATFLEYLMGFSVILAMLLPSGLYVSGVFNRAQGLIATGLMSILLVVIFGLFFNSILKVLVSILNAIVKRLARAPIVRKFSFVRRFTPEDFAPIDRRTAVKVISLSLLTYFIVMVRGVIFLKAFNIDVNLGEFALLHVVGYALSCIGLTPANIGVTEMGWYGVLTLIGAGHEHAALFAVGQRIINTGTTIVLAVAGYVFYSVFRQSGGNSYEKKGSVQDLGGPVSEPQERS